MSKSSADRITKVLDEVSGEHINVKLEQQWLGVAKLEVHANQWGVYWLTFKDGIQIMFTTKLVRELKMSPNLDRVSINLRPIKRGGKSE